jgi:hypothetical protein
MSRKSEILGVVVLARNGDREEFYQDPKTYAGLETQTTPLGEVRHTTFLPSLSPSVRRPNQNLFSSQ